MEVMRLQLLLLLGSAELLYYAYAPYFSTTKSTISLLHERKSKEILPENHFQVDQLIKQVKALNEENGILRQEVEALKRRVVEKKTKLVDVDEIILPQTKAFNDLPAIAEIHLAAQEECDAICGLLGNRACTGPGKRFYFNQVQLLLNNPSELNIQKRHGDYYSAYFYSVAFDQPNICKLLLLAGTNFSESFKGYETSAIDVALREGNSKVLKVLLDWRKEKNITSIIEKHDVYYKDSIPLIEVLLDYDLADLEETWQTLAAKGDVGKVTFILNRLSKLSVEEHTRVFHSLNSAGKSAQEIVLERVDYRKREVMKALTDHIGAHPFLAVQV